MFRRTCLVILSLVVSLLVVGLTACQRLDEGEPSVAAQREDGSQTAPDSAPQVSTKPTATVALRSNPETTQAAPADTGIIMQPLPALIDGFEIEAVPAPDLPPGNQPRFLVQPAHTVVHLSGYPDFEHLRRPSIAIYPVAEYAQLRLLAERQAERLQLILADWTAAQRLLADGALPYLPEANAVQIVQAKVEPISFEGGQGIRYLTQFVQDISPVVNRALHYTFQGMTDDGRFYVSAILPVSSSSLPQDIAAAQEDGFERFAFNFDQVRYQAYLDEQQAHLNSLESQDFNPSLTELDALIESLNLTRYEGPGPMPWTPEVPPAPDQVVDRFLDAYIAQGGFSGGAQLDNLALHPDLVAEVGAFMDSLNSQGILASRYDPLLMTTARPDDFGFDELRVGPALMDQVTAKVRVERHWHYSRAVSPIEFNLVWDGNRWLIRGVDSIIDRFPPTEPTLVAQQLMAMLTASTGQFSETDQWLAQINPAIVAPNSAIRLCDQIWPVGFAIEGSYIQQPAPWLSSNVEAEAMVVVYLPFTHSLLTVKLAQQADTWQVTEMVCGDTPAGRALAFYAWYLGAATPGPETRWTERTPYVDDLNPGHYFVTDRFLREANERRATEDPYLPPAEVADRFSVAPGSDPNTVLVELTYLESDQARLVTLILTLEQQEGKWRIDDISSQAE
ncbi:MAG: DUF3828 domain-containing protein [Candidatus Promineifilaceae bacterium]|nr:DUF3828 domain-containing protein [Candidatus Promineifilaceae bacterium]